MTELLSRRDAVSYGLSVMATRMVMETLPDELEKIVGERTAATLLAMIAAHAAEEGFKAFTSKLGIKEPLPLDKLLEIFVATREKTHPFQLATRVRKEDGKHVLELAREEKWSLPRAMLLAGVITGVLNGSGYRSRTISTISIKHALCTSHEKPKYATYPASRGGAWLIVVEELQC